MWEQWIFFVKKIVWPVDPVIFLLQNITFTYSTIQHDCRHLHSDWPREACRNCLRDAHADRPRDAHSDWLRYSQADRLRDIWLKKIYHIARKNYFIYLLLFCIVLCSGFVFVFHFSYNYQLACLTFLVVIVYSLLCSFFLHISNNYQLPCLFFCNNNNQCLVCFLLY